jgi:hypothetical protein
MFSVRDFDSDSNDDVDHRPFPCACHGPSLKARHVISVSLNETLRKRPLSLPEQPSTIPVQFIRDMSLPCNNQKCYINYADMTVQLLNAIYRRNTVTDTEEFEYYNQTVRDFLHYINGDFLRVSP